MAFIVLSNLAFITTLFIFFVRPKKTKQKKRRLFLRYSANRLQTRFILLMNFSNLQNSSLQNKSYTQKKEFQSAALERKLIQI